MSGRSRQHAEAAVAMDPRRRHQGSEAVEQLERGQALRATATGACFICAYIERTIGLEDGAEAQCAMETGRGRRGKIVVRIA